MQVKEKTFKELRADMIKLEEHEREKDLQKILEESVEQVTTVDEFMVFFNKKFLLLKESQNENAKKINGSVLDLFIRRC